MIGHLIPVPVVAVDGGAGHAAELALQRVQQRQLQRRDAAQKRFRVIWRRHKVAAHRFRQGFDQRNHQLAAQAGNLPLEPALVDLV